MVDILSMAQGIEGEIINIRRIIHQNPELAFYEHETAKLVEEYLSALPDIEVLRIGETGVVGILKGKQSASQKTVALRADMDALPISETTGLPYASKIPGRMHACGHDVHTSVLLGTAKLLSRLTTEFSGSVKFIFQPAEETLSGAKEMVRHGVLSNPEVNHVVGFHCWPEIPVGTIGIRKGTMFAASDTVKLNIIGKAGHAAHPHQVVDPVTISAQILVALQTIISREIPPISSAVLSIGQISGGTAPNIIPDKVELLGTIRTIDTETRNMIPERIKQIAESIAKGLRGEAKLECFPGCGPVIPDDELNQKLEIAVKKVLGVDKIIYLEKPSMGSEDFAFYVDKIPGLYFRVGSQNPSEPFYPLHSSNFKVDEKAIVTGISSLIAFVLEYFSS